MRCFQNQSFCIANLQASFVDFVLAWNDVVGHVIGATRGAPLHYRATESVSSALRDALLLTMDPILAPDEVDAWLDVLTLIETYTPDVNREYKQYTNSEGRHYYYKLSNGEVSWTMPPGFLTRQQMANIMSQYFMLLAKGLSKDSTTAGVPFAKPHYPVDPPPVCHPLLILLPIILA